MAAALLLLGSQLLVAGVSGHLAGDSYGRSRKLAIEINRDGSTADLPSVSHPLDDHDDDASNLAEGEHGYEDSFELTTTAPPQTGEEMTNSTEQNCAAGLGGQWYILTGDAYSPAVTITLRPGCLVTVAGPSNVLAHHEKPGDEAKTVSFEGLAEGRTMKVAVGPWDSGTLDAVNDRIFWSASECSHWAHPCTMVWDKHKRELPPIPLPAFISYPSIAHPSGVAPLREGDREYLCPSISGDYQVNRSGDLSPPITVTQSSSTEGCAVTVTDPERILCQPKCPNGTAVYRGSMGDGVVHVQISHYDTGYLQDDGSISWSCAKCSWWTRPCNISWVPAPTTTTTTTTALGEQCADVSGVWKVVVGNDTSPDLTIEQKGCDLTLKDSEECFCPPACPSSKSFKGKIAGSQINMTVGYYDQGLLNDGHSTISWKTSLWFEGNMTWSKIGR